MRHMLCLKVQGGFFKVYFDFEAIICAENFVRIGTDTLLALASTACRKQGG